MLFRGHWGHYTNIGRDVNIWLSMGLHEQSICLTSVVQGDWGEVKGMPGAGAACSLALVLLSTSIIVVTVLHGEGISHKAMTIVWGKCLCTFKDQAHIPSVSCLILRRCPRMSVALVAASMVGSVHKHLNNLNSSREGDRVLTTE